MTAIVYQITCTVNLKSYIGITCRGLQKRWADHRASAKSRPTTKLHWAIRKHGVEAFEVSILETVTDFEVAKAAEVRWIETLKPAYNMTSGGDGTRMPRGPWSAERRAAFSAMCKARGAPMHATRAAALVTKGRPMPEAQRLAASRNFKCSAETRAKLAASQTGRVYSAESRAKMSASAKKRRARSRSESNE
jgi:group I intron endonuclease